MAQPCSVISGGLAVPLKWEANERACDPYGKGPWGGKAKSPNRKQPTDPERNASSELFPQRSSSPSVRHGVGLRITSYIVQVAMEPTFDAWHLVVVLECLRSLTKKGSSPQGQLLHDPDFLCAARFDAPNSPADNTEYSILSQHSSGQIFFHIKII